MSLKLTLTYFVLCIVVFTPLVPYVFNLNYTTHIILLGLLFAVLAYGIDPAVVLSFFKHRKNKVIEILEIESIITPSISAILSILILNVFGGPKFQIFGYIDQPVLAFFQQIIVGIVFALAVGYFLISILKKNYFGELTHLGVLTSAIIVYVGTEYFGGSGVLAIAIFGVVFGNSHVSHLIEIEKFESILSNGIKILMFMFLGTMLLIHPDFIGKGTLLFFVFLIVRYISVLIAFRKEKLKMREIVFISLNVPKGIDVVVILLLIILVYSDIINIAIIIYPIMLMILYSITLSAVVCQLSGYFLEDKKGKINVKKIKRN